MAYKTKAPTAAASMIYWTGKEWKLTSEGEALARLMGRDPEVILTEALFRRDAEIAAIEASVPWR